MVGRSDQKLPSTKDSSSLDDSETPIYQFDGKDCVDQPDKHHLIVQDTSMQYHDSEDQHDHHRPIDQQHPTNQHSIDQQVFVGQQQLGLIDENSLEESNSRLSVTRTDFSSTLDGWGDEAEDADLIVQSTNF